MEIQAERVRASASLQVSLWDELSLPVGHESDALLFCERRLVEKEQQLLLRRPVRPHQLQPAPPGLQSQATMVEAAAAARAVGT